MASILVSGAAVRSLADGFSDPKSTPPPNAEAAIATILDPNVSGADGDQCLRALTRTGRVRVAVTISSSSATKVVSLPVELQDPVHACDGMVFGVSGELSTYNLPNIVKLTAAPFEMADTEASVLPVDEIVELFQNDPELEILSPPAGTRSAQKLKYRRGAAKIPFPLIPVVLRLQKRLSPRVFFLEIYPQINTSELKEECKAFIEHFQVLATASEAGGKTSLAAAAALPTVVEHDGDISGLVLEQIFKVVPELQQGALAQQVGELNATVAAAGDKLVRVTQESQQEQRDARLAQEVAREQKKTIAGKLGDSKAQKLFRILGVASEEDLDPDHWSRAFAREKSPSPECLREIVSERIFKLARNRGIFDGIPQFTLPMAKALHDGTFYKMNQAGIAEGFFDNLLLFGALPIDWQNQQINDSRMMENVGANASQEELQRLLKMKVYLPTNSDAVKNIWRAELIASVVLTRDHAYLKFLRQLHQSLANSNLLENCSLGVEYNTLGDARGVLFLESVGRELTEYWRNLDYGMWDAELPKVQDLLKLLRMGKSWVPSFTPVHRQRLNLDAFCGIRNSFMLETNAGNGVAQVNQVVFSDVVPHSAIEPSHVTSTPQVAGLGSAVGLGSDRTPPNGGRGDKHVTNENYNSELFLKFKSRKNKEGKEISMREFKDTVIKVEATQPPKSRYFDGRMCVAWHVKGRCNEACGSRQDHKTYSAADYQPLVDWCEKHYPKGAE